MKYSADSATPVAASPQDCFDSFTERAPVFASLHDWAEFSALFQKLDEAYAETLSAPLLYPVEDSASSGA